MTVLHALKRFRKEVVALSDLNELPLEQDLGIIYEHTREQRRAAR